MSSTFENLRIVSDEEFDRCEALVKGRAPARPEKPVEPIQQGSRNLLTRLIFCGYCGNRLCYSHNKTHRKLASGTERVYERQLYRCYRRISSPTSCEGPSGYEMEPVNEAVEVAVRDFLNRISVIPREDLITMAGTWETKIAEAAYKRAVSEFNDAQRQVDALEAEALRALTGENQLDLGVVNSMLLKQKARLDAAAKAKEETKVQLEIEKNSKMINEVRVDEMLTWATRFDEASYEAKHLVIAQLVDRNEIRKSTEYEISIHFRMTAEQFLGRKTEASA